MKNFDAVDTLTNVLDEAHVFDGAQVGDGPNRRDVDIDERYELAEEAAQALLDVAEENNLEFVQGAPDAEGTAFWLGTLFQTTIDFQPLEAEGNAIVDALTREGVVLQEVG